MASNITPFLFEGEHLVRMASHNGEPRFVLADVCRVLEIGSPHKAAERLDDDEKGRTTIPTPGGDQEMTTVKESGLYSLILTSRKPAAKRFKKWITAEVLPALRRTGSYSIPGADPQAVKEDLAARRVKVQELNAKTRAMTAVNHSLQLMARAGGPKAIAKNATTLYGSLGLTVDMSSAFDQGELDLESATGKEATTDDEP